MSDMISDITGLIASEVFGEKWESKRNALLTQEYLEELFSVARAHDVAPILASALIRQKLLPDESPIKAKWIEAQMSAIYRYARLDYEAQRIFALFEERKIPFIPLKGAVIRNFYPEAYLRTSCDVDVLIQKEDLERAKAALVEGLGYAPVATKETSLDISFTSPGGVMLELHYALIAERRLPAANKILSRVFEKATPRDGFSYYLEMQPEVFMLYHVAHMAKHFVNGGCGIRSYIDLYLLTRSFSYDKERFLSLLKKADLESFYLACMDLCAVWFAGKESGALSQRMEAFVFFGGAYGSMKNHIAVKGAKGKSKLSIWLRIIFLPRRNLEILYPQLRENPNFLWMYQIRRWCGVFKKEKRQKIKDRSEASRAITRENQEEIRGLLQELELV